MQGEQFNGHFHWWENFQNHHNVQALMAKESNGKYVTHGGFIDIFNILKRLGVICVGGLFSSHSNDDAEDVNT